MKMLTFQSFVLQSIDSIVMHKCTNLIKSFSPLRGRKLSEKAVREDISYRLIFLFQVGLDLQGYLAVCIESCR